MKTKNLGVKRLTPSYPEQYYVVYLPEDTFLRQLFNRPLKPVTVGYIRYRDLTVECHPMRDGEIDFSKTLYTEKFPDTATNSNIPFDSTLRVIDACKKSLARYWRFQRTSKASKKC